MVHRALLLLLLFSLAIAQSPYYSDYWDYYAGVDTSLSGRAFEEQLTYLVSAAAVLSYDEVWEAFNGTDTVFPNCTDGTLFDIYSDTCWKFETQQCGNYQEEGDCYNREHSWPNSWWGGKEDNYDAYTDLHHVYPTDGYDNGKRSNYPYGDIIPGSATYTTSNGCQLGVCDAGEYGEVKCWEMVDSLKGDLARAYFYMSTRYLQEFDCCDEYGVYDAHLREWMEDTLRTWNKLDPVDEPEMERNNVIYQKYQGNRNPYIDYPEWVEKISNF